MGRYRRYLIALAVVVVLLGAYAVAGFWACRTLHAPTSSVW